MERIGRIEVVRRLDERHFCVTQQPADRHLQEGAGWDVVAVKHRDEFALSQGHRVIQIAGFGVRVVRTNDVAAAAALREVAKFATSAVVQNVGAQLVTRPIHRLRCQNGRTHDVKGLIIGRNIDIDRGPLVRVVRQRHRPAL